MTSFVTEKVFSARPGNRELANKFEMTNEVRGYDALESDGLLRPLGVRLSCPLSN